MRAVAVAALKSTATVAAVAALTSAACTACASCDAKTAGTTADAGSAAAPAAFAAPRGLLLDVSLRNVDAAWSRLQRGAGGALSLMPSTLGELTCALAGIDGSVAPSIDGQGTAFAVAAVVEPYGTAWAIALPLTAAGRGDNPFLSVANRADDELASLQATTMRTRAGGSKSALAPAVLVAIAPRWLFVASDAHALAALGPYAVRPRAAVADTAPSIHASAPAGALAWLASDLEQRWAAGRTWLLARDADERSRHEGRTPDFADPIALLDRVDAWVGRKTTWLRAAGGMTLDADTGRDDLFVELRAAPGTNAPLAGHGGDTSPLADVAADSPLAICVRDDVDGRVDDAEDTTAAIATVLGARLPDASRLALGTALDDWARGRGDWTTLAMSSAPSAGLSLRTPAADASLASRAVHELLRLSHRPPFVEPLASLLHVRPSVLMTPNVTDGAEGAANHASFAPLPGGAPLEVNWGTAAGLFSLDAGVLSLAASRSTPPVQPVLPQAPGVRLGDRAAIGLALASLGDWTTFALVAQPLRLIGRAQAQEASGAPLVFGLGRRGDDTWARIDVADGLIDAAVRSSGGFF